MILVTCLTANRLTADDAAFGYSNSCHQNATIAASLCNSAAAQANTLEGDNLYSCVSQPGGIQLRNSLSGGGYRGHHFYHFASAGSSFCSDEFQEETANTIAINQNTTDLINLDDYVQTQFTTINQNFADIDSDLIDLSQITSNNQTAIQANDQQLVTINGDLIDLSNRTALIESDIGTLQETDITLSAGVSENELYIQGIELEFDTYQAERAQADAVTNTYLNTQQLPVLQSIDNNTFNTNSSLSLFQGNFDSFFTTYLSRTTDTNNLLDQIRFDAETRSTTRETQLDELKTAIEGVSFDISGQNISIDNTGVESALNSQYVLYAQRTTDTNNLLDQIRYDATLHNASQLTESQLQTAELVRSADALEEISVSLTVDPSQADDSYVNTVSQYLNALWEQELVDYDNSIRAAIEAAQLEDAGLDTTDVEIIGAQMTGWAAAQTCVDYTFNFGDASFPLYCVKTEPFRNLIGWALYILTAYTIFGLIIDVRVGRFA